MNSGPAGDRYRGPPAARPSTLRSRLQHLPPPDTTGLWANQAQALSNVEERVVNVSRDR